MDRRDFMNTGLGVAGLALASKVPALARDVAGKPEIRWGLIGIGNRCEQHIRVLNVLPGSRIVALCDIKPEAIRKGVGMATTKPEGTYADHQEMLKRPDLDAVLVCTPNHLHREMVVAALASGRHVLTEKPMGITVEECNDIIQAGEKSGKVLQVGLELRYSPYYQRVRKLLQEEKVLGAVKFVWFSEFRGDWVHQSPDPAEDARINWRYYQKLSGGTLLEKSCHYFDLFNWFIGTRAERVCGMGGINVYANGRETLDHASVIVEYAGGAKATHGLAMYSPKAHDFIVIGEKGQLDMNYDDGEIVLRREGAAPEVIRAEANEKGTGGHSGTMEMHQDFQACVREGRKPLCDAVVGKESIRVGLAGEIAIRERRWVEMKEIPA